MRPDRNSYASPTRQHHSAMRHEQAERDRKPAGDGFHAAATQFETKRLRQPGRASAHFFHPAVRRDEVIGERGRRDGCARLDVLVNLDHEQVARTNAAIGDVPPETIDRCEIGRLAMG